MNCSDVQDRLSTYFDGGSNIEFREAVAQHLFGCHTCALEFVDFRKLSEAASRLQNSKVTAAIWASVSADLNASSTQTGDRGTINDIEAAGESGLHPPDRGLLWPLRSCCCPGRASGGISIACSPTRNTRTVPRSSWRWMST